MTNIAEILKDAPKGLELYSQLLGNVYVDKIINYGIYRIQVIDTNKDMRWFMQDGRYINYLDEAECILFPSKEYKSWDNWQEILFQKGDVIVDPKEKHIHLYYEKGVFAYNKFGSKFCISDTAISVYRYATPEEREQFFKELNDNGYIWNDNTKQMEKIEQKNAPNSDCPGCVNTRTKEKPFTIDDFKPFDKVLVQDMSSHWTCDFYIRYDNTHKLYACITSTWDKCIPYNDETKHLLGTKNDCPKKYKTW